MSRQNFQSTSRFFFHVSMYWSGWFMSACTGGAERIETFEIRCRSKIFARTICNYSGDLRPSLEAFAKNLASHRGLEPFFHSNVCPKCAILSRSYFVTSYVYRWLHYLSIIFFRMGEYQVRTAHHITVPKICTTKTETPCSDNKSRRRHAPPGVVGRPLGSEVSSV